MREVKSIEELFAEGRLSRISELELPRYVNFFENSYKDNLEHAKANQESFPRWGIISGYYAMHDITKLLLARNFRLKVELKVHETTIMALSELIKDRGLVNLLEKGYSEFMQLANDLAEAKWERTKVQYYTGTEFMREQYRKTASLFIRTTVEPYLQSINRLVEVRK